MGNVHLRIGNIFDNSSDLVLLPCSAKGSISRFAQQHVKNFGLPTPTKMNLGEIQILTFTGPGSLTTYVAWCASVFENSSSREAIEQIGIKAGELTRTNSAVRLVEAPLLGTGAGGLSPEVSATALAAGFRKSAHADATLVIFSPYREVVDSLRNKLDTPEKPKAPKTNTRDRNLLRLLLLQVRDGGEPEGLDKYEEAQQVQHSALLINDGYVNGRALRGQAGDYVSAVMTELTSKGHDFLESFSTEEEQRQTISFTELAANVSEQFRKKYPDPQRVAFIMMRFEETNAHKSILKAIKGALEKHGIEGLRADEFAYEEHLYANIQTYMHGCGFGIAVFERIVQQDFNPNVSFEVGYMLGVKKPVLLLKDKTLSALQTDLAGRLYRQFDPQEIDSTISLQIEKWLREKSLGTNS